MGTDNCEWQAALQPWVNIYPAALSKHYVAISRLHVSAEEWKTIADKEVILYPTDQEFLLFLKDFSPDEPNLAISSLQNGKCARPDGVFPDFIKNLGPIAKTP